MTVYDDYEEKLPPKTLEKIKEKTENMSKTKTEKALEKAVERYEKSKVVPGEPVGTVAGQSFGERATQMTLSTFHVAGLSQGVSVVQGIPRLEELMEVRKKPKAEVCRIRLKKEYEKDREKVEETAKSLEEIKVDRVAKVQEGMDEEKISVIFDEDEISKYDIEIKEAASKIKDKIRRKPKEIKDNKVIFDPNASSLKSLRRYASKVKDTRLKGIKGIKRATLVEKEDENGEKIYEIQTDGTNLKEILEREEVNSKKTIPNSVREVKKTLGIEAARQLLFREIKNSIEKQGLSIDERHMMLFADAITRKGDLSAIGRHGISGDKRSVLGKAAFETQMKHLLKAAQTGEIDPLKGIAERTIVGEEMPAGTGSVKLRMNLKETSD